MSLYSHAFAGNPIRTRTPKQTDPFSQQSALQTLKTLLSTQSHEPISPDFKVLPFRKGRPLAGSDSENGRNGRSWHLGWLSLGECRGLLERSEVGLSEDSFVYLGCRCEEDVVYWAVDVSEASRLVSELGERQFCFVELRTLMVATDWADAKAMGELPIVGHARALLEWHNLSRFCGNCGAKAVPMEAGRRKQYANELCKKSFYPPLDPVVIMLVIDKENDHALLSRQSRYVPHMWSCLAGFIEPGESLEEAVRRETWEETGIEVGEVVYHSSQPWPAGPSSMPCQLMVGFFAYAKSFEIHVEKEELEASMAEGVQGQMIGCETSSQLWMRVTRLFASRSKAKVMHYKLQLQTLKKGGMSMKDYLSKMKNYMDILAACGHPVKEEDQILYVLGGVGIEYDSVVVHITSRSDNLNLSDVSALLLAHEGRIEAYNLYGNNTAPAVNVSTLAPQRKTENSQSQFFRGAYQRGRARGRNIRGGRRYWQPNHGKPVCQICGTTGHVAEICYYRFDKDYVPRRVAPSPPYQQRDNGSTSQFPAAAFTTTGTASEHPTEYKKAQKTSAAKVEQMCKGVEKGQQLSADFNIESGELAPMFIPGPLAIAHHLISLWVDQVPPNGVKTQKQASGSQSSL
ncbi:nudix hydrolase 19, chloroplastic-like [Primulina tabacum]|uniref:nudix hydrolase 19, chloroplastic-like n=1 Tax=Primulina tabacum TaxID=48773 RepID=UPI003F59ABD1